MRQRQNSCVISIRFSAPGTWIGVFAFADAITDTGRPVSRGIPPVRPPLGPSRMLDSTLHRAAETVGSKADVLRPDRNVFFGRGSAPQPFFSFRYDTGTPASTINEFLQTILPAFTIPTRTSSLFQPLRRYGRPMGKRLPSAYLWLKPFYSRRVGYLHLSRVFRQ